MLLKKNKFNIVSLNLNKIYFESKCMYSITFLKSSHESKVLQYFSNMKHNSTDPDVFTEVVKVMNPTGY